MHLLGPRHLLLHDEAVGEKASEGLVLLRRLGSELLAEDFEELALRHWALRQGRGDPVVLSGLLTNPTKCQALARNRHDLVSLSFEGLARHGDEVELDGRSRHGGPDGAALQLGDRLWSLAAALDQIDLVGVVHEAPSTSRLVAR